MNKGQLMKALANVEALTQLTSRQRDILILRYGLFGRREHMQKEVAEIYGDAESKVREEEESAIAILMEFCE